MGRQTKQSRAIPVVVLKTRNCYNAFSPVVDGCAVTAKTIDEALTRIREALEFHLEGERLVKHRRSTATRKALKMAFEDYGTEAVYASVRVPA